MAMFLRVLILVALILLPSASCKAFFAKTTVNITNLLSQPVDLHLHCKSKNDDLGPQTLKPDQSWAFRFRVNIFATTLFFCSFKWEGIEDVKWFDIYNAKDADTSDCDKCYWKIHESGPCRFDTDTQQDICFRWK